MSALPLLSQTPIYTLHSFFPMLRPPRISTLFPYTTLFRSHRHPARAGDDGRERGTRRRASVPARPGQGVHGHLDRKSTRLNSSHVSISYAVFCLKKKNTARVASIMENTNLSKQHTVSEIMR